MRGLRSLTMIASSVENAFRTLARPDAVMPIRLILFTATSSPWYWPENTSPLAPAAKGTSSTLSSSSSKSFSARSLSWRASARPRSFESFAATISFTSSSDSCCFVFWSMTVLTSAAIWSSFRPSAESSSLSTALPFWMPHMIAARCAAAWLFASTVCWPRSWIKPSIFSKRCACSASCWRSNAEPSSLLSSQSRLSRRPKRRASSVPEQSFENAPFCENCWRNLAASSSAWPMAVTVRATASTCPVGRPCVALTTSWSFWAISVPRRCSMAAASLLKRTWRTAMPSSAKALVNGIRHILSGGGAAAGSAARTPESGPRMSICDVVSAAPAAAPAAAPPKASLLPVADAAAGCRTG
mmetsp:Transcript_6777/g.21212  ORF Transcript_6777/g.21212 Transcript_6777/m.21212 type:complete len:356 (-) Transcript_6777:903-1970(-)